LSPDEIIDDTKEYGIIADMTKIARFKLIVKPTLKKMALTAEATPLCFAGTEPITELMLGEENIPMPAPKIIM